MSIPNVNLEELNQLDSNMKVSNQYFTESDILKSGGIIYDPSRAGESGPSVLPDVAKLLDTVTQIIEYMCTDEMIALKEKCKQENTDEEYEFKIEDKFPEFSSKYYSLFKIILDGGDLTPMYRMFSCIDQVNKGQTTLENVEIQLGEELANEYIKPVAEDNINLDEFDETNGEPKKKRKKNKKKKRK